MFDFLDMLMCGQKKELHGKKWVLLKNISAGCYLAVEENDASPAAVKLLIDEEEVKNHNEKVKELKKE